MELIKAHINSFGKLQNIDYDFSKGLNTICNKNGYGKTTFTIFLKAMFYGMQQKGNNKAFAVERSKYAPWQGGNYGGSLTFRQNGKLFTIVRSFGKTPESDSFQLIDEQTGLLSNAYSKDIGIELFGVGVETFQITAFFSQDGLTGNVNDEVRATLTGANKYQNDLSDCTFAQAKINSAIKRIRSSCPKQEDIVYLKQEIKECTDLQAFNKENEVKLQKDYEATSLKLENLKQDLKKFEQQDQTRIVAEKLKDINLAQLQENKEKLEKLNQEKQSLASSLNQQTRQNTKSRGLTISLSICVVMLLVGFAFVISSFFAQAKTPLLTSGIVIIVLAIIVFGVAIIKKVGANEHNSHLQKEELAKQLRLADVEKYIKELEGNILQLNVQLEEQTEEHDGEDYNNLQAQENSLENSLAEIRAGLNKCRQDLILNEENINELNNQLASLQEKREDWLARIKLYEKAIELLEQAKNNVSQRYLQPMQKAFDQLFSMFDNQQKLMLDINLNINQLTNDGLKESEYLSQGYRDLLSICRRLALLKEVFVKEKPFIILDDPFVNLDDKNLQIAKKIVSQFAENYQIVYICSNSNFII